MPEGYVKRLVCLASSRKMNGTCIAAKEIFDDKIGGWIRPVSNRPSGELWPNEFQYTDGTQVQVGDDFFMAFDRPAQHLYQSENHIIDKKFCCGNRKETNWMQLRLCIDQTNRLIWPIGFSTRYGSNDQVPLADAAKIKTSLSMIEVLDLELIIAHEWPDYGNKRRIRGTFSNFSHRYTLMVTDPRIEARFAEASDGLYHIGSAILCISLGEPYKDHAYKLIASVNEKGF